MEKGVATVHEMHLFREPFEKVRGGKQNIDVRLYDEKRRGIRIGDIIAFKELPDNKEEVECRVIGLSMFGSFRDLFSAFERQRFGHSKAMSLKEQLDGIYQIYSKEDENKYGVLGIHMEKL